MRTGIGRVFCRAQVKGEQLSAPFPRLTYADAMERYGCDKPDTRYGLELRTVSNAVAGSTFRCAEGFWSG